MGKHHLVTASRIKALLWIAVLIGLWELYNNDVIANAALAFVFGGVVPGTNIIMAPDTVIFAAAGTAIGLIVLAMFASAVRYWRLGKMTPVTEAAEVETATEAAVMTEAESTQETVNETVEPIFAASTAEATMPTPVVQSKLPRIHLTIPRVSVHMPRRATVWIHPLGLLVVRLGDLFLQSMARIRALAAVVLHKFVDIALATAILVTELILLLVDKFVDAAKAFWRWAEPRIRRFDAWLQKHIHAAGAKTKQCINKHDDLRFILLIGRESAKMAHAFGSAKVSSVKTKRTKGAS